MKKIKFEDFNDLEVTKAFDRNGYVPDLLFKMKVMFGTGKERDKNNAECINKWKEMVSNADGLDNILYLSNAEIKKFSPRVLKDFRTPKECHKSLWGKNCSFAEGFKLPEDGSVGIVYCEIGLSILYVVYSGAVLFTIFDENYKEIRNSIITKKPIPEITLSSTNPRFLKYGEFNSDMGFGVLNPNLEGDKVSAIETGPMYRLAWSLPGNKKGKKAKGKNDYIFEPKDSEIIEKELHLLIGQTIDLQGPKFAKLDRSEQESRLTKIIKDVFLNYEMCPDQVTNIKQILYDANRKQIQLYKAGKIIHDIVFNLKTDTVVFTESMVEGFARGKGTEKDESLIGITRILNRSWMKEIIVDHPIDVSGHWARLRNPNYNGKDPFGNHVTGKTWVRGHVRKGYHRRPQRDIEFEKEGS